MATKLSLNLPDEVVEELKRVALSRNVTLTQALKDAIHLDDYMRSNNRRVLVEEGGQVKEVTLAR